MYTEKELTELEQYFKSTILPKEFQLSQCEKIIDMPAFIKSHLHTCRVYPNSNTFSAFYDRLVKLKALLAKT